MKDKQKEAPAQQFEVTRVGTGLKFAVVVARFNELVTERLLAGAQDALRRHGVDGPIDVAWVPGAFDLGPVARRLARSRRYDAVICLGAVIRGGTAHFEHVASQAASGVAQAAWDADLPVVFGVLTTDDLDQALERAGGKAGNKGFDAGVAAIELAQLWRRLG